MGSGCGSVGRAVASDTRVRSSNPVIGKNLFIKNICLLTSEYWKDKNKEKEAGNGPFKKIVMVKPLDSLALIRYVGLYYCLAL